MLALLCRLEVPLTVADACRLANCTTGADRRPAQAGPDPHRPAPDEPAPCHARGGRRPRTTDGDGKAPIALTAEQADVLDASAPALEGDAFAAFLLHGVTGSGKTEVYLSAIERVVARGREAIVLVPEISLTPQTIRRFRRRFDKVAVLHSHLSDAERHRHWRAIAAGEIQVVVGARSAVFAPTRKLGLIVIDEEHESTFKQETTPRYHARDVAVKRAQLRGVPVILGSATPALETWRNAEAGRYTRLDPGPPRRRAADAAGRPHRHAAREAVARASPLQRPRPACCGGRWPRRSTTAARSSCCSTAAASTRSSSARSAATC